MKEMKESIWHNLRYYVEGLRRTREDLYQYTPSARTDLNPRLGE
jgi:hypothetical protein